MYPPTSRSRQHRRHGPEPPARHDGKVHGLADAVACGPALAAHRVGRVAIRAQRCAIDKGVRHGAGNLLAAQAQQLGCHGGRGDLAKQHVVQADLVERVLQGQHALDLVRLDQALQDRAHGDAGPTRCLARPREPVGDGEDAAQVVGRMAPFRR